MSSASQRQDTFVVGEIGSGSQLMIMAALIGTTSATPSIPANAQLYLPVYYNNTEVQWVEAAINSSSYTCLYSIITYTAIGNSSFNASIAMYTSTSTDSLIGYYNNSTQLSTTSVTLTISSNYPTYGSSSILSSVPYLLAGQTLGCTNATSNGLCTGEATDAAFYASSMNVIFLPYQWYTASGSTCNLSNPAAYQYFVTGSAVPLAASYQQCFLANPSSSFYTSSSCIAARQITAYSDLASCQQYSDADRYYYALNTCGQSFSYSDLRTILVTPDTSLGSCDSGDDCLLTAGSFSCQAPAGGRQNGPSGDDSSSRDLSTQNLVVLWIVVFAVMILVLVIIVVIGTLIYKSVSKPAPTPVKTNTSSKSSTTKKSTA